jgi:hypothetical protein
MCVCVRARQLPATGATKIPAPTRRNTIADEALASGDELMDSGLTTHQHSPAKQRRGTHQHSPAKWRRAVRKLHDACAPDELLLKNMAMIGLTAPVFTNYASRGEVRTVKTVKNEYTVVI